MSKLTVELEQREDWCLIHIAGYLSADSSSVLDEAFAKATACDKILLVFSEKMFINSTGLLVLFNMIFAAQEQNKQVRIAELAPHFEKMFAIMGLDRDVEIFTSKEEALRDG